MSLQIVCHMGKLTRSQAYISKKQPFVAVFEREIEGWRGMNWHSPIPILGSLDLFNPLLFLAKILFISSVR